MGPTGEYLQLHTENSKKSISITGERLEHSCLETRTIRNSQKGV